MKNTFRKSWPFIVLAVLAFTVHLAFLSYPSQVVFDEVHFGKFVGAYFTGQYYFDIHPPLGKLMIAGWAKLSGVNPNFDFDHIGEAAPAHMFFVMRFLPAFFGGLFVLAFSWLAWLISRSKKTALIAGVLILLDNAFLVQSHFILVDIFMLTFEVLALCFFFLQQRQKSFGAKWFFYLILTILFFGLAISIKWTGLATIGIIGVVLVAKIFSRKLSYYLAGRQPGQAPSEGRRPAKGGTGLEWEPENEGLALAGATRKFIEGLISLVFFLAIGLSIYIIPYFIHFNLLPNSGPGDAFMSSAWQQELKYGRANVSQPLSFWQKFIELNKTMYTSSSNITAYHPYASRWYTWPFAYKFVYYWNQDITENQKTVSSGKIFMAGNPFLWWLAAGWLIFVLLRLFTKNGRRKTPPIFYLLALAYFANLLPFLGIKRVSFLYHYMPAALYAVLLLSFWLAQQWLKNKKIFWAALFLILAGSVFLAPLSYGWQIPLWASRAETRLLGPLYR